MWKEKSESGWQKCFSFGQAKYSAGIMHQCGGCKADDYPCKVLKKIDGSTYSLHAKHTIVKVSVKKSWNLGSLRVYLLAIHLSVSEGMN